ncbi:hypothetical protein MYAM1_001585 [Malassezia yamatoensis]|uniref:Uncharacterized protein n=1 Tax=Malassezia yamatoensis TaxID=253288 RepID=A0AAJ5YSC7_9BASI|nr:hypothetical protein MYAM1_001585 [Malassezia yamatoensis]
MNSYAGEAGVSNEATSSALTWQQQLMNDSSSSRKTRKEPHIREKREAKPRKPKSDKSGSVDALKNQTWQQELFHQAQPRKSAYDFAVDARDRETFGEGSLRSKNAANTQETRKKKGKTRVLIKTPKTPNQDVTTTMAYAGPTFHNSPHAASLPAPTFQGKSKLGSANEKDSNSDLSDSDTGENSVTPLPTNSKAVLENSSETAPATQKPANSSQTGQRHGSASHVRQPMELLQQAFANHAQSSNSSLLYTEEAGAAALVSTGTEYHGEDSERIRWNLAGRDAVRRMCFANAGPLLYECNSTFQLFPESGQQQVSGSNRIPIYNRAAHAVRDVD